MLTCVCRPVSGTLPKMPPTVIPMSKQLIKSHHIANVIICEPKLKVSHFRTSKLLQLNNSKIRLRLDFIIIHKLIRLKKDETV